MQRIPSADPEGPGGPGDPDARAGPRRFTRRACCAVALVLFIGGAATLAWLVWLARAPQTPPPRVEGGFECIWCNGDCSAGCGACSCFMLPLDCQGEEYNTDAKCYDRAYDRPLRAVGSGAKMCGFGARACGL